MWRKMIEVFIESINFTNENKSCISISSYLIPNPIILGMQILLVHLRSIYMGNFDLQLLSGLLRYRFWHELWRCSWSLFRRSTAFFTILFLFFHHFSVTTISNRTAPRIKKLRELMGVPKNLWVDPFPDPVGHFGAP